MSTPLVRPRFSAPRCLSPILAMAFVVVLTPAALAQRSGGTAGGTRGGGSTGGTGNTGGMGNTGNTGNTGGGGANGAGGGSGLPAADQIFADGIQREGPVEQRAIDANTDPGARGGAGAQGGALGGGFGGFGGMGGFGGFGGLGGLSQMFGGAGQNQQPARSVRTRLSSAVAIPPLPPQRVGSVVNARLSSLPSSPRFDGVQVQMDGRTAILTGQVASEEDKRMTRLLIRLEPGVSRIDDRLEVAAQ